MLRTSASRPGAGGGETAIGFLLFFSSIALATDWPQFRGPTMDGVSPDPISTNWPVSGPPVVWSNWSLTNGFSSFAVSQGRAFANFSKVNGSGTRLEYCAAVDAATGTNLWARPTGLALWDPSSQGDGGAGLAPFDMGDGPRSTPSVVNGRVVALSSYDMHLVCLNVTNGSVLWSNDLISAYGASSIGWDNCASPTVDNDLTYVNLNKATDGNNLAAFRVADGSAAWRTPEPNPAPFHGSLTHTTPTVATIQGVRQVIFATQTGLVSLDRSTGAFLWEFVYPFDPIDVSMGASPIVYSNMVYCTAAYFRAGAAARITSTGSSWIVTQLWVNTGDPYRSIWMTPVIYQGYIYTLQGENNTFLSSPVNCIELATGNLQWSANNFGMGGMILVNGYILILSEDGQLVLVQPNPSAYTELARFQAFSFSDSVHGKCWISPAYSNGRIYAHSTTGGIAVDVSLPPALKLLSPRFLSRTQLQLTVSTADGSPVAANRLPKIQVLATNSLRASLSTWPMLTNPLVLGSDGLARLTNTVSAGAALQFYRVAEQP
jgi:outer membrane protein assembly factor BamB